jgi:hypothetical protein
MGGQEAPTLDTFAPDPPVETPFGAPVVRELPSDPGPHDRLLAVREVASCLGVSSALVYKLCQRKLLRSVVSAEEALRYAMSLPVATTISGIDSLGVLRQNLMIARGFKPMAPEEMQALRQRCRSFAADGHLELYKSTKKYDGGVGREQHGYPPPEQLPI